MPARSHLLSALLLGAAAAQPAMLVAQNEARQTYDLPRQDLADALRTVAERGNLELYAASADLEGRTSAPLEGVFTPREAVEKLLRGSGLVASFRGGAVTVSGADPTAPATVANAEDAIVVTGTRISGAPAAAPVIRITSRDIRNAGHADLGEVARSLPQNFGGGQNPGVGGGQGTQNENVNVNGASTFNLRGIGPNATLTLLNGTRFASTGSTSVLDISAIPVSAIERLEIVTDGASAIYGADAVAGVVNILLRKDYEGLTTSARLGKSTDGGNFQQQYNVLRGLRWSGGGLLATYDYFDNSSIEAGTRSYAGANNPENDLYPNLRRHSVIVSANHALGPDVELGADFLGKWGESRTRRSSLVDRPFTFRGIDILTDTRALGVAPRVDLDLGGSWSVRATGFYGIDETDGTSLNYFNGTLQQSRRRFDNRSISAELGIEGPVLTLPAGSARLAAGGGIRNNRIAVELGGSAFRVSRENYFAYGELFVPLVAPAQDNALLDLASITAALRWEDYSDSGSIATPKVALLVEPSQQLRLGLTWGRSFKLPTLTQQYSGYAAVLLPISGYGDEFPAGSNLLYVLGPNPEVGPERSENWTFSATFRPTDGFEIVASLFQIDYRDRVAPPLRSFVGALTDPNFAQLVTRDPSAAFQQGLIDAAEGGLQNATAAPYDPANVAAVLDGRDRNIAEQVYRGVDLSVRHRASLGASRTLELTAAGSWLESSQRLLPGLPRTDLAGTLFNAPLFRARAGATLAGDGFSLSSFIAHTGSVTDRRRQVAERISGVTTFDLTARFTLGDIADVSLVALNIFNAKPEPIFIGFPGDGPFDMTNYSATGRFLGLTVSRTW